MEVIPLTKEQLKRYLKLTRDVQILKKELEEMENGAEGISGDIILNYKSGQGIPQMISGFDWKRYNHKQNLIEKKEKEKAKIQLWIDSIDDGITRQVFKYRYIEGLSWEKIADLIGYPHNKDYPRIVIQDRYLEKEEANK